MWTLVGLFVVSLGRWIAYALAAGTLAQKLSSQGAARAPRWSPRSASARRWPRPRPACG